MGVVAVVLIGFMALYTFVDVNKIHEGTVTSKQHEEARSATCYSQKNPACRYHPERWTVTIQKGKDTNELFVSEKEYKQIHVGQEVGFSTDHESVPFK